MELAFSRIMSLCSGRKKAPLRPTGAHNGGCFFCSAAVARACGRGSAIGVGIAELSSVNDRERARWRIARVTVRLIERDSAIIDNVVRGEERVGV